MPVLLYTRLLATTLLILACTLAGPSDARQNNYVRCLQEQLIQLGENPGPIDGVWGGKTKRAAIALRDRTPELRGNPYLTEANRQTALSWCREVGIQFPDARPFMPSYPEIHFVFDKELLRAAPSPTYWHDKFTEYTNNVRKALWQTYGIERTSKIDVVIGEDPKQIARNLNRLTHKQGIDFIGLTRRVRERCTSAALSGAVFHHWMYICASEGMFNAALNAAEMEMVDRHLEHVLMHEYIHIFQSEYSLYMSRLNLDQSFEQIAGPLWLMEGAAEVVAYDLTVETEMFRPVSIAISLYLSAREHDQELTSLTFDTSAKDYLVAHFATYLLAARFGKGTVLDYWRLIGQGLRKEEAFETLFGMTVTAYETLFEDMRKDSSLFIPFAKGESLPDRALPPQPRLSISN